MNPTGIVVVFALNDGLVDIVISKYPCIVLSLEYPFEVRTVVVSVFEPTPLPFPCSIVPPAVYLSGIDDGCFEPSVLFSILLY